MGGGNAGVSAEVQDGIFQNVHNMSQSSFDALHRMLAFEKEFALMRTKCQAEEVWTRYKDNLEEMQLYELKKAVVQLYSELMLIANTLITNLSHLRQDFKEESKLSGMY